MDDPHRGELGSEPAEVLSYLRKHGSGLPEGVRVDDLFDAAVLHVYLWWQAADRERWLLNAADRLGVAHRDFGAMFGMRSRQGFRDRADRLHALLADAGSGRPDEKLARADRAAGRGEGDAEAEWLAAARDDVLQLAGDVVAFYDVVDDETADELSEVRRDLREDRYGKDTFVLLGYAVDALAECRVDGIAEQARPLQQRLASLRQQRTAALERPSG
ncbi:hypothetical protein [Krasilnikovia sp. MM14-A1259]|uniref:hypothetical protein n=1 Tax=Krasilnikovia sp. MM14-A1259 TaxID=3373539 RepID=UPI00399CF5B0